MTTRVPQFMLLALAATVAGCPPTAVSTNPTTNPAVAGSRVLADLAGDFVPAKTAGAVAEGEWRYFMSSTLEPATWKLVPLRWGQTWRMNDPGDNFGYVADNRMHLAAVSGPAPAIKGQSAPAKGFCAMHPGSFAYGAVAEWTCPADAPAACASGTVKMVDFGGETGIQFWVWKKSPAGIVTNLVPAMTIRDNEPHAYSASASLSAGDKVYFVIGAHGAHWSDHTHVAARITAPK